MAYNAGFTGIYGDRLFINAYYMYINLKSKENSSKQEEHDCCSYFVIAVRQCLSQINKFCSKESRTGYLDWLRWYSNIIIAELESFKVNPDLQNLNLTIDILLKDVNDLLKIYFQLNETEKAVSNEYLHAFDRADCDKSNLNVSIKVFQDAGRLLINYVKCLAEKKYLHDLDRTDKCFEQLKSEAKLLASKLQYEDNEMASDILTVIDLFENLRQQDEGLARGHDIIMEHVIKLTKSRATESTVQTAIRYIKETITLLQLVANKKINEAFKVTKMLVEPVHNCKQTWSNLVAAFKNPLETWSEIKSFAINNPWKCGIIILGETCVGAIFVGLPVVLVAYTTGKILLGGVGIATPIILVSIAAGNVLKVKHNLVENTIIEEAKIAALKAKNKQEGRQIARKILYDHHLRQRLREAKENAEREFEKMQELEQQTAAQRNNQIKMLNTIQCEEYKSKLQKGREELDGELKKTQPDFKKSHEKSQRALLNVTKIQKGMNASIQQIEQTTEKYKLPAVWRRNDINSK